jgi:hypothetical protein
MLMFLALFAFKAAFAGPREYRYCVPIKTVGIDPFREIVDGKMVAAYLLMTRPYISLNSEPGILSAYELSPDGTVFTGRVNSKVRFNDGSKVSPYEAAYGIAHGIAFRPLREKVSLDDSKFKEGIEVIDDETFAIHLKSKIMNLVGVLREALSSGSAHNRMWPVKLHDGTYDPSAPEVVSRYPYSYQNGDLVFTASGNSIRLVGENRCKNADFGIFFDSFQAPMSEYLRIRSNSVRLISVQTNSKRLPRKRRSNLIGWIRSAYQNLPDSMATEKVNGFFLEGESGYEAAHAWDDLFDLNELKKHEWVLTCEGPALEPPLKAKAKVDGIRIRFVPFAGGHAAYDARVMASAIHGSRHVILQDILAWSESRELFSKTPKTVKALTRISESSAETVPPAAKILSDFEKVSQEEGALAPLARRYIQAYSKKDAPLRLELGEFAEHVFVQKN